jgi:biofilm PGA synthesis N-glycosyltransferase PgaC
VWKSEVAVVLEIIFWVCAGLTIYVYIGYPLLLGLLSRLRPRPARRERYTGAVSIVVAAHNEEAHIGPRLRELLNRLRAAEVSGEIIVVSDGSTDKTAHEARAFAEEGVRVLEVTENRGKAAALSEGCKAAQHPILVFADTRQRWDKEALRYLLENFADPTVGAVSGDLVLESAPGVMAGVGLYWRMEKRLRKLETRLHSMVGVTGAICAVRHELFRAVPPGTLLDDVYWPMQVALQGYRVVHDERAHAYDRLPEKARDEFRRKVRTLSGNFQLVARLPETLVPWRNPLWWQFISHKLLRLAVPWALLGMLISSWFLSGPYELAFWAQAAAFAVAVAGAVPILGKRLPLAGAMGSLMVLNTAAFMAFWVWLTGRAERSWHKVAYAPTARPLSSPVLKISH